MTQEFVTLPREVVERALAALDAEDPYRAAVALRAALEQPQAVTNCHQSKQLQGEQEPFTVLVRKRSWLANQWEAAPRGFPDYGRSWADERVNVYTHPQNLNCKSTQARLATLWGYVKEQPKREPLTHYEIHELFRRSWDDSQDGDEIKAFARAIEAAHNIK